MEMFTGWYWMFNKSNCMLCLNLATSELNITAIIQSIRTFDLVRDDNVTADVRITQNYLLRFI